MDINSIEQRFLDRRRRLLHAWRIAGPLLLLVLIVTGVLFFINYPLMFNPFELVERLKADTLDYHTLQLMALLLPVAMLMLFFLLVAVVLLAFAVMSNDRKYLAIIDRREAGRASRD